MERMTDVIFLFSLNLKFKNKPGNDYSDLSPSCWIVTEQNLKTQNKPKRKRKQTNKTTKEQKKEKLAFTIQKFFEVYLWENCLLCSHGEVNWQSLTSQHRLVCQILHCKHICLLDGCIP